MTKQLHQTIARWVLGLLVSTAFFGSASAATLFGAYTIDATQAASTTNFKDLSSAITYLTSAGVRTDGGPANSAPFGVSGQVTFNYAVGTGPYNEQVVIPAVPGASPINNIIINGNGCTMQFNTTTTYALIRMNGADHFTINNLKLKTLATANVFGIHFMGGADSNTVYGCTIDLTAVTGWSSTATAIAFSSSLTSSTSGGVNGYYNTIINDTILNSLAGGPYYTITNFQNSNGTVSANRFIGNLIDNIGYMGYYAGNTNGTMVRDNEFRSTTKTSILSTRYDVYCPGSHTNDTVIGNRFHDPFGTLVTTTIGYYGIYMSSATNSLITNNRFYDIKCNWDIYAIYLGSSSNARVYHNVIALDHTASTVAASNFTYGIYATSSTPLDFRNNIVSMTRGGSSLKVPVFLNTTGTYTINNNNYYVTGQNANIGFNNGALYSSLSAWKSANVPFDTSSYTLNPRYVSATNLTTQEAMLNNAGANVLTYAPVDANNIPRTTTPDIGAYEFTPSAGEDAGVVSLTTPSIPFNAGSYPVSVKIKNAGLNTLNSVSINWSVNGVLQTPYSWSGSLNPAETSPNIPLGNYSFTTGVNHNIIAWTSNPNATTDASAANDSSSVMNIRTTMLGGTYTINAGASSSPSNFTSFTQLSNALSGGITGPVVVNVVSASGPYTEQVAINTIPGVSATNNVVINGNANTLQFNATASNYAQLRLNGAKYLTIQNLTVKALNNTYSWGLHFMNNADSNKIINCNFDLTANISNSTYSGGIVFSNSFTNPTTSGSNGRGNLISGCTITGSTSGGNYYAITHFPTPDATTASNNKFINNTIQNFYNIGIYAQYTNGTLYKGNIIKNDNRTSFTTIYGIYVVNGSRNDTIINNIIENPFGSTITTTSEFDGIYLNGTNTPAANPNLIANNIIRNVRSNGIQYGIRGSAIGNNRLYHNTIIIDNPTSTSASTTYGIFVTGAPVANGTEIKNNIVYINRPATNTNYNIYLATASANFAINNNAYYKTAAAGNVGYYAGTICNTFAQWQAVNSSAFDAAGKYANPYFTNISTNSIPRDGSLNGAGANVLTYVGTDFAGNARSATPDIGAYEYTPAALDAGIDAVVPPPSPFAAGSLPVNVRIRNGGTSTLTSTTVNWTLNGVTQTPFNWTGSLASGAISTNVNIGNGAFAGSVNNTIVAWTSAPNGGSDGLLDNDSATISGIYTALSAGTYTINKNASASATNFTSFTAAASSLNLGGVAGAVTIDVVAGSGPYTEQVTLNNIPGTSASAKVTINGNNQELSFNNTVATAIHVIGLNNTKQLVLNNLRIRTLNATYGVGIMLTNSSDSNIIQGCSIDVSSITGTSSTASAGIAFSASFGSAAATAVNTGAANLIQNNTIDGGAGAGCYYGIIVNATNVAAPTYSHNRIIGNTVKDFYNYGIYLAYSARAAIKNNTIYRPTKAAPAAFYGIYVTGGSQADTLESNLIYQPYGAVPNNASAVYGIQFSSTAPAVATPSIIKNNVITDFKGAGTVYGISNSTNQYIKIFHNTIHISDLTSTSTSLTYGIHSTGTATSVNIKNNVVNIEKGGSGDKYALYFATASTSGYLTNNNSLRSFGTSNANIGYYSAAFNTLTNWKTANTNAFDQNSVSANPLFRNQINPYFLQPGNDTLDNVGTNLLGEVPVDFTGAARTATPDLGAYNFITYPNDAGVFSFNALGSNTSVIIPVNNTFLPVDVTIKNYGTAQLTSASISWSVSGVSQSGANFSGALAKGDTAVVTLGAAILGNGINQIKAWTSNPNASTDASNLNDTLAIRVCTPISGELTLNALWPDTGSNFTSFTGLFNALKGCGVSGPVNVRIGAGTYAQQLTMPNNIPGQSSVNTITFNGGDSAICKVTHAGIVSRATLLLDGAKNYIFRNITFIASNTTSATAVQLMNLADSNSFIKCAFNVPGTNSTAVNPFVASGSVTSATTAGNACNYLYVDSCSTSGGYYGMILYGNPSLKSVFNTIKNSRVNDAYFYGTYLYSQSTVSFIRNSIQNMGLSFVSSTAYGLYISGCDSASYFVGNRIFNLNYSSSVYGIYAAATMGSVDKRAVIGNNTIDVGVSLLPAVYGIYDAGNKYTDILYNTVRSNSSDPNYGYGAYYNANGTPATYTNTRIFNNIFVSPNGSLAINFINQANTVTGLYTINNNVYYSSNLYPYRVGGFITNTLTGFATSPQMLGPIGPNNANSLFLLPQFDSKMRSLTPQLDEAGTPMSTLTYDVDSNVRNATIPDIGAYEFTKIGNDAGVAVILNPVKPLVAGLNDIKVAIRNYGLNTLTTCEVSYRIGSTVHTRTYNGSIATLAYDTVVFDATSGPGGTSQQYSFSGGTESIKVWTSFPNTFADSLASNDTAYNTLCTGIAGVFTIDAAGSGPNNFTSIQSALDKLDCGGVYGHVTFNIAPGTYTGQYTINTIIGVSDTSTITFKSANNNPASVVFTSAPSAAATNYTIYIRGAKFIRFESVTLQNTSASFGRVVFMATNTLTNITTSDITIRNCIVNGQPTTNTTDVNALLFANTGNITNNLSFIGNTFNNGSMAVSAAGPAIVNQYSAYITIDSNIFNSQYYYGMNLSYRSFMKIRKNTFNLPSTAYYGIYTTLSGAPSVISENVMNSATTGYGIAVFNHAYYNLPGELAIRNNVINLSNTSGTQYGISISSSSYIDIHNNTVKTASSSSSYAVFLSGHAPFLSGITNYPGASFYTVKNNILRAEAGYALYSGNIYSDSALAVGQGSNRNMYSSGSGFPLYARATNFDGTNFRSGYRNIFYSGSDSRSQIANIAFTSPTNLMPNQNNSSIWYVNGGAERLLTVTNDVTGTPRSASFAQGTPDIGAHEVVPMTEPNNATIGGTPTYGGVQAVLVNGDTTAWITWGFGGTLPTTLTAKYYPGSYVSHPAQFPTGSVGDVLDEHWMISQSGGSGYSYDIKFKYDPNHLGTIPSESDIRFARKDSGVAGYWIPAAFTNTILDTIEKTFGTTFLYSMYLFTGTTDMNPLPVKLTSFVVRKDKRNGVLNWVTAMERNSARFEIERSEDGSLFTKVGEVKAAGNTSSNTRYSFTDSRVADNIRGNQAFYRLKMINRDGSFEYSEVRSISFDENGRTVAVYPNPFNGALSIELNSEITKVDYIVVTDVYGKEVLSIKASLNGSNKITLDQLSELATGVYIVKSKINNVEYAHKVIKQ